MLRICLLLAFTLGAARAQNVSVALPKLKSPRPLDGRLMLLLSTDPQAEPRFQINDDPSTQQMFGLDVENWIGGQATIIDSQAFGYPTRSLNQMKPGDYFVQVFLDRYETFHLASGQTVKLPTDRGEGRHWNLALGNLYSEPRKVHIDRDSRINVTLDKEIAAIPNPKTASTSSTSGYNRRS